MTWISSGSWITISRSNIIKDEEIVEKKVLQLPKQIKNVIRCKNPRCITNTRSSVIRFSIWQTRRRRFTAAGTVRPDIRDVKRDQSRIDVAGRQEPAANIRPADTHGVSAG